jgi:enoyl-CoA hydratase/carnithine racemase
MRINWTVDESGIGTIEIDHQDRLNALTIDDWRTMRAQLACRVASRRAAELLFGTCPVGARRAVRLGLADATASELGGGELTFSPLSRLVGSGRRLTRATGPRLHQTSARPRRRLYALCRRRGRRRTPSKASSAMHNLFMVAKNEHD